MKADLSNTSFIIHYRKDSEDRAFNLKTIYRFLTENVEFKELIIVNDNSEVDEEMELFKKKSSNIIPLFMKNDDHFKKSLAFNVGASYATGEVLCFYDVDILIEPSSLNSAQAQILFGEFDQVYPFNGTFKNIKKPIFENFLNDFNFSYLKTHDSENIELSSPTSPGGCNLISKKAFGKIHGYDEGFIGWGFEDTDFFERSSRANKVTYLNAPDAICWHLDHSNSIRLENPHYNNNLRQFIVNNRTHA